VDIKRNEKEVRLLKRLINKYLAWSFQRQADKIFLKSQGENNAKSR